MSFDNRISLRLTAADQKKINEALKTAQETLKPYLVALTTEERRGLPKMSDRTTPFVEKALDYAQTNPALAPSFLNVQEFKVDLEAVYQLTELLRTVDQLSTLLNDTVLLAGSEAYEAALSFYSSVKQAAKVNVPGAKGIADDLGKRFEKSRSTERKTTAQ